VQTVQAEQTVTDIISAPILYDEAGGARHSFVNPCRKD
jgi:hypothetical protein